MTKPAMPRGNQEVSSHKESTGDQLPDEGNSSAGEQSLDRLLLIGFGIAFIARLLERVVYIATLIPRPLDAKESFALTEWLINYSGGFVRRGLPGQAILLLNQGMGLGVNLLIAIATLGSFAIYAALVFTRSKGVLPRWTLLTSPLLGYAVYMSGIMLRKDIVILLLFFIAASLIVSARSWLQDLGAAFILTLLILIHEGGSFVAIPSIALLILLREISLDGPTKNDANRNCKFLFSRAGVIVKRCRLRLLKLAIPLTALACVVYARGNSQMAITVMNSWQQASAPGAEPVAPHGAVAWLGANFDYAISLSMGYLNATYYGMPYWLILTLAGSSAVALITLAIHRYSPIRAWFFLGATLSQLAFMSPLFYFACDHSRWLLLAINSAFAITILTPMQWQETFASLTLSSRLFRDARPPVWIAPLGLALWGLPFSVWNPHWWLASSPSGIVLQIYFYLRTLGILPRLINPLA